MRKPCATVGAVPAVNPDGRPLLGTVVRLDPLTEDDAPGLLPCFTDPAVYAHGYVMHAPPADVDALRELLRRRFLAAAAPGHVAYAIRLVNQLGGAPPGTLVGTSSLLDAQPIHERIHLGSTLYGSRWWGTAVNPEAKLLLLGHVFDDGDFGRVRIQTDALNVRSRAAITKLGASQEGILRRHMRREDGTFRDTVVFSIVRDEWPQVRDGLRGRLHPWSDVERPRTGGPGPFGAR